MKGKKRKKEIDEEEEEELISFPAFDEARAARARTFYDVFNPVDFYEPRRVLLRFTLDARMATISLLFFFTFIFVFFLSFRPCLYVVGGLLFVCVSRQHTHTNTPHTPLDRKKKHVFLWISIESYSKVLFFFLMLSPNLSRSKPIVKTL